MTAFKTFNREDVPPYFRHLMSEADLWVSHLRTSFEHCLRQGYLDPDSHERNVLRLQELRRLNDEIYALGRIDARHPAHAHGVPCPPMRGEKAAIERLLHFVRTNPKSTGVLRFMSAKDVSGERA